MRVYYDQVDKFIDHCRSPDARLISSSLAEKDVSFSSIYVIPPVCDNQQFITSTVRFRNHCCSIEGTIHQHKTCKALESPQSHQSGHITAPTLKFRPL
jgi:hypothetical protein